MTAFFILFAFALIWIVTSFTYKPDVKICFKVSKIYDGSGICVICTEPMKEFTLLNCGHKFCPTCILQLTYKYWNLNCPTCRSSISFILPQFKADATSKNNTKMIEMIEFYNTFHNSKEWEKCVLFPKFLLQYTNFSICIAVLIFICFFPRAMEYNSVEAGGSACKVV